MPPKDIRWLRTMAEGCVIVASILLAFALDAWWDNRGHARELREQREVVAREMQSTRDALKRALDAHDFSANLAEHLLLALGRVVEGSEVVVADTLVGPLLPQITADVTTRSLDAFITAGGLQLIQDVAVRQRLLDWPTQIQDLQDDETYLRDHAAADLASYLRAHFPIANAELMSIPWLMARFGQGRQVEPDLLGTVTLRREQQFMNLLAARASGERALQSGLVDMFEQTALFLTALGKMK